MIGGAADIQCAKTFQTNHEVVTDELGQSKMIEKAKMLIARAAFGCAVYPNYSQIFVAGGSTSETEATK